MFKFIRQRYRFKRQAGFSLAEALLSAGISGIVFYVLSTLMGTGANFSAFFHQSASTAESLSEAVNFLTNYMPQMVRVSACRCRSATNSLTACRWYTPDSPSYSSATPYYDPAHNGGATGPLTIFQGNIELYHGGTNTMDLSQLRTANMGTFGATTESTGCAYVDTSFLTTGGAPAKGCKQLFRLIYTPPIIESGGTPATSGRLRAQVGTTAGAGLSDIGDTDRDGKLGVGVSSVSCGFVEGATATKYNVFKLKVRIKARSTTSQTVADTNYESWHPSGKNFGKGFFRDLDLNFTFPNLINRGVYSWRTLTGSKRCLTNGTASTVRENCCSFALNVAGTACSACTRSGVAAGADHLCCSERRTSGGLCS